MATLKGKVRVIDAKYIDEANSLLLLVEYKGKKFRTQIPKDSLATFGNRSKAEIKSEMEKTANMMVGKTLEIEIDNEKMEEV